MCSCKICIAASIMQCELYQWISRHIFKLISVSEIPHQNRKKEYIYEVYPNVYHRYERTSNVEKSIYFIEINPPPHSLQIFICVLGCCGNFINKTITEEESNN